MKNYFLLLGSAALLSLGITSCNKESDAPGRDEASSQQLNKPIRLPQTAEEKELVGNFRKVTDVLKELYKKSENVQVVNASVAAKIYTDESILLRDLIFAEESRLKTNATFLRVSSLASLQRFSQLFWQEVEKKGDNVFKTFLNSLRDNVTSRTGSEGQNCSIYFPYSDELLDPNGTVTTGQVTNIVTATADADEGVGELPIYVGGVFSHYAIVTVNDDYAELNPTHIVGWNGPEAVTTPPPPPPPPPGISRIYVGEVICKNQYDKLISFTGNGGGSEVKYCHLTGYLQPVNGQVTSFQDIASVDFSRSDIKNKRWLRKFLLWDDDWHPNDTEQVFAIYEEDNTSTRTFTGSVSTTLDSLGIPVQASIGFSVTINSQDDIIRQLKIARNAYFTGSFEDQGQGFSNDGTFLPLPFTHGWPAYDVHFHNKSGANVGWTWPYKTM